MMMSSELPVYAVVDKSRKNRDEPATVENETNIDVPDKDAPQFPARNTMLKKKPLTVSPYKPADEKSDTLLKEKQETGVANTLVKPKNTLSSGLSKYIATSSLAVIIAVIIIVTFILSIVAVTVRSDVAALRSDVAAVRSDLAALQEQLSIVQQNLSESIRHNLDEELRQNISRLNFEILELRAAVNCPPFISSCIGLAPSCPSDYYWVRASNGSAVRVYCDMTLSCGNITGGWMRVAELNMTDTSQQCPSSLVERNETGLRQCQAAGVGCVSVNYSIANIGYSSVCGRITAYQVGSTNAFRKYIENQDTSIESAYVDGVSLTHGSPREHIWTFAAALDRNDDLTSGRSSHCPCRFDANPFDPPPFVGDDYACDAGNEDFMKNDTGFQTDPLWDGTDCLCCFSDNPPWFYKQLSQPTTDDIEMRVCRDESDENIAIAEIEIYVQ